VPDYFQTVGFQRDFAKLMQVLDRLAAALERIAAQSEKEPPASE